MTYNSTQLDIYNPPKSMEESTQCEKVTSWGNGFEVMDLFKRINSTLLFVVYSELGQKQDLKLHRILYEGIFRLS